ncbi:phosphatidylserine decarboxylase-domain-containing protein [Gautieria morchelliformis]|nr:phosphatidylserine decarboxylase-domain-containing protein [Gautieria morchelliformis]
MGSNENHPASRDEDAHPRLTHELTGKSSRRTSARPGTSFDRTFSPSHQRTRNGLAKALILCVDNSEKPPVTALLASSLAPATRSSWLAELFDKETFEKLFAAENLGNFVIVRKTGAKEWEYMPIYARVGLHLLFYGPAAIRFVTWSWIRRLLKEESIRQGKIYDSTDPKVVLPQIQSFLATYSIDTSELLEPDLTKYPSFNSFFSRRLKPNARPAQSPNDPSIISSAADSRLMVFNSAEDARNLWIKGRHFTVPTLLQDAALTASLGDTPCLAVWRLAPQDYHRFHSPVSATIRSITHIPGEYYTVNPLAVNEDLDVFTANTRSVAVLDAKLTKDPTVTVPVALVAVGALLVGSIAWEKGAGQEILRGEGLGYFAYGGSTVIAVFPKRANIQWDKDLLRASGAEVEVLLRAGEKIGVAGFS